MPAPRKQKSKARKSREVDMLPGIENLDIMLGGNHLEREESKIGNSVRRPESPSYITSVNHDVFLTPETVRTQDKLTLAAKLIDCLGN